MGHLIKLEQFGQGNDLESSREFSVLDWKGIWRAVEDEMDRTDRVPRGMEGWEETGCVLTGDHECDERPDQCWEHLKDAVREWIESAWKHNELRTGSFCFAGPDWSAITFNWDGN